MTNNIINVIKRLFGMVKDGAVSLMGAAAGPVLNAVRLYMVRALEAPNKYYARRIFNNMPRLYAEIKKGDVLLVQGRSEMARIIHVLTQSCWSHAAFYVGDALIREGAPGREEYLARYGDEAKHLIIEAYAGTVVHAVPISCYKDYNLRLCRAYGISDHDLDIVIKGVISNLGKEYDDMNILDLALMRLIPFRRKSVKSCLGSCGEFQVICSGMIAKAFQGVGYPIIPSLAAPRPVFEDECPYGSKLIMRHYSQILPRDFDLSPNFEVIKFNIIKSGAFDYKSLWQEGEYVEEPDFSLMPEEDRMDLIKVDDVTLDRSLINPHSDSVVVWITKMLFRK